MVFFNPHSSYWRQQIKTLDPITPLSLDEAIAVFDRLANNNAIPFYYTAAFCEARAHLMCLDLIGQGYLPGKAWAFAGMNDPLEVYMPHREDPVRWSFHTAPALPVYLPDTTTTQVMVFDPSLFDGPALPVKWAAVMNAARRRLQLTPLGRAPKGFYGDYAPFRYPTADQKAYARTSSKTLARAEEHLQMVTNYNLPPERVVFSCGHRPAVKTPFWETALPQESAKPATAPSSSGPAGMTRAR